MKTYISCALLVALAQAHEEYPTRHLSIRRAGEEPITIIGGDTGYRTGTNGAAPPVSTMPDITGQLIYQQHKMMQDMMNQQMMYNMGGFCPYTGQRYTDNNNYYRRQDPASSGLYYDHQQQPGADYENVPVKYVKKEEVPVPRKKKVVYYRKPVEAVPEPECEPEQEIVVVRPSITPPEEEQVVIVKKPEVERYPAVEPEEAVVVRPTITEKKHHHQHKEKQPTSKLIDNNLIKEGELLSLLDEDLLDESLTDLFNKSKLRTGKTEPRALNVKLDADLFPSSGKACPKEEGKYPEEFLFDPFTGEKL